MGPRDRAWAPPPAWHDSRVAWGEVRSGRALDRLLNFSDAVVAVAITILALPLVDIAGPSEGDSMIDVLRAHLGEIQTFVVTFIVVGILWGVHNRIVNVLRAYDSAIFWLSLLWLMGFVFMPWPSSLYDGSSFSALRAEEFQPGSNGAGVLYWLTVAYISLIGALTAWHISRHPDLVDPSQRAYWKASRSGGAQYRSIAFTAVFVIAAVATYFVYSLGNLCLLLFIPIAIFLKPARVNTEAFSAEGPLP